MRGPGRVTKAEIAAQAHVTATPEKIREAVNKIKYRRFMTGSKVPRCAARVYGQWSGGGQCHHKGKLQTGGFSWCGHHDPDKKARVHAAEKLRWDNWTAERDAQWDRSALLDDAKDAVLSAARGHLKQEVSFDDLMTATERLVNIEATSPTTEGDD